MDLSLFLVLVVAGGVVLGMLVAGMSSLGRPPAAPAPDPAAEQKSQLIRKRAQEIRQAREVRAQQPVLPVPAVDSGELAERVRQQLEEGKKHVLQEIAQSMVEPACPSCGKVLLKMPQRKTKCKSCGEFIFIKDTPENREKRLMTAQQADLAEQAWKQACHASFVRSHAQHFGISDDELDAALERSGGDMTVAIRAVLTGPALAGDRRAVWGLMTNASTGEEMMAWQRMLLEIDLAKLRHQGIRSAQLSLGRARGCSVCYGLNGSIISTSTGAGEIIKADCERLACSPPRTCGLMAHGAIHNLDGTWHFDQG